MLFNFLKKKNDYNFFFTLPGRYWRGIIFLKKINNLLKKKKSYFLNTIQKKYFYSLVKNSNAVFSNSSSGIIEMPSLKYLLLILEIDKRVGYNHKISLTVKFNIKKTLEKNLKNS